MKKRIILSLTAAFFAFLVLPTVLSSASRDDCTAPTHRAMYCNSCGFGNKKDNFVKCGKWVGSTRHPAFLCGDCGFGNKKDNCVKCGKWVASSGVPSVMCGDCGFGNKKDLCVKCGK